MYVSLLHFAVTQAFSDGECIGGFGGSRRHLPPPNLPSVPPEMVIPAIKGQWCPLKRRFHPHPPGWKFGVPTIRLNAHLIGFSSQKRRALCPDSTPGIMSSPPPIGNPGFAYGAVQCFLVDVSALRIFADAGHLNHQRKRFGVLADVCSSLKVFPVE